MHNSAGAFNSNEFGVYKAASYRSFPISYETYLMTANNSAGFCPHITDGCPCGVLADSSASSSTPFCQEPVISSVWLEQGEYFFDDEFSLPLDTHFNGNISVQTPIGMTMSLDAHLSSSHAPLQLDQSYCDSCVCTPGDSGEIDLTGADNEQVPSNLPSIDTQNHTRDLTGLMSLSRVSNSGPLIDNSLTNLRTQNDGEKSSFGRPSSHGNSQHSTNGSQISGQSCSASWMQMVMERSCNPDLKALLSRAAAAIDYKLVYGDSLPMDSSTSSLLRQLVSEKTESLNKVNSHAINRSLSHGNLFAAAGLAGLRMALDQAAKFLPKPNDNSPGATDVPQASTQPVNASISDLSDTAPPNTTTWAQKHGSRESLRRISSRLKVTNVTAVVPQTSTDIIPSDQNDDTNPWRMMKRASGTLITWNQLKRTIKKERPLSRVATMRNSRRDQRDVNSDFYSDIASDTPLLDAGHPCKPSSRSRSQPVSTNHYMHRFSGTLLEIFMRARAEEMSLMNNHRNCGSSEEAPLRNHLKQDTSAPHSPLPDHHMRNISNNLLIETSKHPLLRGERILPKQLNPSDFPRLSSSMIATQNTRIVHNFGVQFPPPDSSCHMANSTSFTGPAPVRCASPLPSATPIARRALRPGNYGPLRHSHPRPQSFGSNRAGKHVQTSPFCSKSSGLATCLTASAGPDSPYMAALRATCIADGYSAGWFGNPRASIAYPGLGVLSIPKPSRLTSGSFLSHTLPDLSFLGQAGAEEDRKGTPTMPKRFVACRCRSQSHTGENRCSKCGCRSQSVARTALSRVNNRLSGKGKSVELKTYSFPPDAIDGNNTLCVVPDLVAGHPSPILRQSTSDSSNPTPDGNMFSKNTVHYQHGVDRSISEPDLTSTSRLTSRSLRDLSYEKPSVLITSSSHACYDWDPAKGSATYSLSNRPKKSVSFSGHIRQLRLHANREGANSPASPEPKVIPRNWGLYGQETPLAEFNPRSSPGRDVQQPGELPRQSDVDVRYHAMVSDVIKAVQETVAYYSTPPLTANSNAKLMLDGRSFGEPLPFSTVSNLGSTGRQPLLAVIVPLTVLLCDGLLPPTKPIFISKPRTRLWQMVEESCRPGPLTGVAYRVLTDAVTQVKAITSVTLEKAKFKAFLCACLNAKALPMWLNAVIANEPLLNRFYCSDAFVRQCRTNLRGLYADLLTHLEQLLAYPFNFDLTVEARKPLFDHSSTAHKRYTTSGHSPPSPNGHVVTSVPKTAPRSPAPPAVIVTRKTHLSGHTGGQLSTWSRFSPPPSGCSNVGNSNNVANIHHYPQHHLPGQRIVSGKTVPRNMRAEDSQGSSVSSDPRPPDSSKMKRPAFTAAPVTNPVSSQVRGRLKTALSSFRRTNTATPLQASSKTPDGVDAAIRCPFGSGIPMSDSGSRIPCRPDVCSRSRPPRRENTTADQCASKLKQPASIPGPR